MGRIWLFAVMLALLDARSASFFGLGVSLAAMGLATFALMRVTAVARAQEAQEKHRAIGLGDEAGRAVTVERKLGGGDGT